MSKTQQKDGWNDQQQPERQSHHKYHSKGKVESLEEIKETDKQPLHRSYTIWIMAKSKQQIDSYENVLKPVSSFNTIEDFWAQYQHIKRPAGLTFGTQYNVVRNIILTQNQFAEGIKPMWEDELCKDGGRWLIRVPKTHTNKYWEDLLLALIGEQFTHDGEVNGVAVSVKPNNDIVFIWNKSGKDQEKIQQLKEDIERLVVIDESLGMKLEYENFAEILARPKTEKKPQETFTRNQPKPENQDQEELGFEARHQSRGGGFTRGRGRGGRGSQ